MGSSSLPITKVEKFRSRKCGSQKTQCFLLNLNYGSVYTKSIIGGTEEMSFRTMSNNLQVRSMEAKLRDF